MDNRRLPTPWRDYEYGYQSALKITREQLAAVTDIEAVAQKSGASYEKTDDQETVILAYLNRQYRITFPDIEVSPVGRRASVASRDKVLILHYLSLAKGIVNTGKMIAYRELPDGGDYFPSFFKRAIRPLVERFGREPERMVTIADKMGGYRVKQGDAAVTIKAFPYVPVTLVLWRGDEEFSPDGNILFDSTISDYLYPEDINVLCQTIAFRLVRLDRPA